MTRSGNVANRQTQRYGCDGVSSLASLSLNSAFPRRAHRNAFRPCDAPQQSRLRVCWSQSLKAQRKPNQPAEIPVGDSLILREILGSTRGLRALKLIGS